MDVLRECLPDLAAKMPPGISAYATTTLTEADRVAAANSRQGTAGDPDCPDCRGKGYVCFLRDGSLAARSCGCLKRKRTAGAWGGAAAQYTLETYRADRPWQKQIREKAEEYLRAGRGWFFVCGRSGSGKTHILCALGNALRDAGMDVARFNWRTDGDRLKALANDPACAGQLDALAARRVLLIDDFWKGSAITQGDVNLAFKLLDPRYLDPDCLTLIASERSINEILNGDQAVGGRIVERARGFLLQTGDENLRLA